MNSLSWFLYLADVIGNVQGVFVILTFSLIVLSVISGLAALIGDDRYNKTEKEIGHYLRHCWKFALVAGTLAALLPSKETIYLIAGSEAGEAVVASEAGQEILNDIRGVIKGQLEALKPKGQ